MDSVVDPDVAAAFEALRAAVDDVMGLDLDRVAGADVVALVGVAERETRRLQALAVDLVDTVDRRDLHRADRHHSAQIMVRHLAKLSTAEARRRDRAARMLRDLPDVQEAYRNGEIGSCQVQRLSRAHANPRVRHAWPASETRLLRHARSSPYKRFDALVTDWVRRVDEDGTCDTNQRNHQNRDARLIQEFDTSWDFRAHCGALQGVALREIFVRFVAAEFEIDWEKARTDHGEAASAADLPRTDGQRRFDALWQIFQQAASTPPGGTGPEIVTNIVFDAATYERFLAKLAGSAVEPSDPDDEAFRCSTLDGAPVEPTEAVAASLVDHVRRVVTGADGVVIDLGRRRRLFTGSARLAVLLSATECFWPGCHVPASACEADHTRPYRDGGCTCPGNGAPACGKHNRAKEQGFTVWRDPAGEWHTRRPDGTEI